MFCTHIDILVWWMLCLCSGTRHVWQYTNSAKTIKSIINYRDIFFSFVFVFWLARLSISMCSICCLMRNHSKEFKFQTRSHFFSASIECHSIVYQAYTFLESQRFLITFSMYRMARFDNNFYTRKRNHSYIPSSFRKKNFTNRVLSGRFFFYFVVFPNSFMIFVFFFCFGGKWIQGIRMLFFFFWTNIMVLFIVTRMLEIVCFFSLLFREQDGSVSESVWNWNWLDYYFKELVFPNHNDSIVFNWFRLRKKKCWFEN